MYVYGELPSDLTDIDETLGPPPAWFTTVSAPVMSPYGYPMYQFGDRPEEAEVNPVEQLQKLKYDQEKNKNIPKIASRYTSIDPLSPLFRDDKAKYGFGTWSLPPRKCLLAMAGLAALWLYCCKTKNK